MILCFEYLTKGAARRYRYTRRLLRGLDSAAALYFAKVSKMRKLAALLFTPLFLCAAPLDDSVQAAARAITSEGFLAHIRTLASDEFGGRGPGTEGERKTVDYLIEQAKKLGLKPGNPNGTYIQQVPLWSI